MYNIYIYIYIYIYINIYKRNMFCSSQDSSVQLGSTSGEAITFYKQLHSHCIDFYLFLFIKA